MDVTPEILAKLREPFADSDLEWKPQRYWKQGNDIKMEVVPYLQVRAIHERLDQIVGPENWRNELAPWPEGAIQGLAIRINGEWVTKWDGSHGTDIENVKGGITGAFKRAAVLWGIGRYLYSIGTQMAEISTQRRDEKAGWAYCKGEKTGGPFWWKAPDAKRLPSMAEQEFQHIPKIEPPVSDGANKQDVENAWVALKNKLTTADVIAFAARAKEEMQQGGISEATYAVIHKCCLKRNQQIKETPQTEGWV